MAHVLKYYGEFKNTANETVRIEFLQEGFTGTSESITVIKNGLILESKEIEKYDPIQSIGGKCHIRQTEAFKFQDLFVNAPMDTLVKIYINSSIYFIGYVVPELFTQPLNKKINIVTIPFTSGLALLKDIAYEPTFTGLNPMIEIVNYCLTKTQITDSTSYFASTLDSADLASGRYWEQFVINSDSYVGTSCYDVLTKILFGYRLWQKSGNIYICRIADLNNASNLFVKYPNYTYTEDIPDWDIIHLNELDIENVTLFDRSNYEFESGLNQLIVNLDLERKNSAISNIYNEHTLGTTGTYLDAPYDGIMFNDDDFTPSGITYGGQRTLQLTSGGEAMSDDESHTNGMWAKAKMSDEYIPFDTDLNLTLSYDVYYDEAEWNTWTASTVSEGSDAYVKLGIGFTLTYQNNASGDALFVKSGNALIKEWWQKVAPDTFWELDNSIDPWGGGDARPTRPILKSTPQDSMEYQNLSTFLINHLTTTGIPNYLLTYSNITYLPTEQKYKIAVSFDVGNIFEIRDDYLTLTGEDLGNDFTVNVGIQAPWHQSFWSGSDYVEYYVDNALINNVRLNINSATNKFPNTIIGELNKNFTATKKYNASLFDAPNYNFSNGFYYYDTGEPYLTGGNWSDSVDTSTNYYIDRLIQDAFQLYALGRRKLNVEIDTNTKVYLNTIFTESNITGSELQYQVNKWQYNMEKCRYKLLLHELETDDGERITAIYE